MSFEPFKYTYTPPATVPEPPRVTIASLTPAPSTPSASSSQARSNAGQLASQLDDLIDTANYLQQIILTRCAGQGVAFDFSTNPTLGAALGRIYTPETPTGISVEMYSNLLDAELTAMQVDMALGNDASVEASPFEVADVMTATKAFESAMTGSLQYDKQLPIMLRSLKGDTVVYQSWKDSLSQYPSLASPASTNPASITAAVSTPLDMSSDLAATINNYVAQQSSIYSRSFSLMTTVGHVEADIDQIAAKYFYEPIENLARFVGLFNALKNFTHGMSLQDLADDLTNFMFVRMLAEIGDMAMMCDRLFQMAVSPLKAQVSQIAGMLNKVGAIGASVGYVAGGGLKGMVQGNPCSGVTKTPNAPYGSVNPNGPMKPGSGTAQDAWNSAFGSISTGMNSLLSHLNWATSTVDQKNLLFQESLRKLASRRINDQNDRIQLLCSMQALDSLINLTKGFFTQQQNSATPRTVPAQLESVGTILSNLRSPSGSQYSLQNGVLQITPPQVPPTPPSAQRVFSTGGLDLVTKSNLLTVNIGDTLASQSPSV